MTAAGERVLDALGATFRKRAGALVTPVVEALAEPLGPVDDVVTPTPRGWARIFDLDSTTQPATLGAATGTVLPSGLTLEDQRAYLRDQPSRRRGSATSIIAAARAAAPGRQVDLFERLGSPWNLQIRLTGGAAADTVTNLSPDPQTPSTASPNSSQWAVANNIALTGHPLGHLTGLEARRVVGQVSTQVASLYDFDGLGNTASSRYLGSWVKVNTECTVSLYATGNPGASNRSLLVPADVWTWIFTPFPASGYAVLEATPTRGSVLDADRLWVGGTRASTSLASEYFDGDTTDTDLLTYAWTGAAGASTSTRTRDIAGVVRAAVQLQKPVGITLDVVVVAGATYDHMRIHHGPTYTAQAAAFGTYDDERTHVPEGGTTP